MTAVYCAYLTYLFHIQYTRYHEIIGRGLIYLTIDNRLNDTKMSTGTSLTTCSGDHTNKLTRNPLLIIALSTSGMHTYETTEENLTKISLVLHKMIGRKLVMFQGSVNSQNQQVIQKSFTCKTFRQCFRYKDVGGKGFMHKDVESQKRNTVHVTVRVLKNTASHRPVV